MSTNHHTVVGLKSSFLRTQTRILSQQLQPSEQWLGGVESAGNIPENVIRDVTREVNRQLRRHNKTVYSSLSIRHVAEQIDQLYWDSAAPDLEVHDPVAATNDEEGATSNIRVEDDLRLDENIAKLPPTWTPSYSIRPLPTSSSSSSPATQEAYTNILTRLHSISARRLTLAQKLSTYRTLLILLKPYRNPQSTIQPNLVTRDATLGAELLKTRTLAIRVAGRVAERFGDGQVERGRVEVEDGDMDVVEDERAKLDSVIRSW
ncbi:hypothetical protein K432DRAFT_320534 [Lepidopterella palustris CBS 459.81]|uniref:Kinetochore protein fta4 n=1 Tax=Lepidopterella palustris CBS 459.81 TaxID=1314670 RepID=A0A8E2JJ57_9PEZI|nr:hypothetical protein K432DRAFT_320534 [Lepidopterella palustris CBS 459.81]